MTGETKMIIITSNEDIIRQFSLNKPKHTHIVDLDNNKQVTSMNNNDNNIMNLAILTELSELNSKNDQIYKRALDSPHHGRSKQVKPSKKSFDMDCAICGDRAIGFNYDVLSCASCKAFFRRNAYQPLEKLKCLNRQNQCLVTRDVRRKCQRCRLARCFAVGMRRDFILSEEEKQQRKQRLQENRNISLKRSSTSDSSSLSPEVSPNSESHTESLDDIDRILMDIDYNDENIFCHNSFDLNEIESTLSAEDWISIENVRSIFLSNFNNHNTNCVCVDISDRTTALLSWSQFISKIALSFIDFFRHIDEFENLHDDDRFTLIKYNLLCVFAIPKAYLYQSVNDCCSFDNNVLAEQRRRFFILCGDSNGIRDNFVDVVHLLVDLTGQDPIILSLIMLVFIFSQGLSMNIEESLLKDPLAVYRAQNHYTQLLWNYFVNQLGEIEACKRFTRLMTIMIRVQLSSKAFREFFRTQYMISNIVDKMAPLMQTVLNIS
ncbi:unnamed protein product [Adineta steineri]|uniref:Uncharacterized protein n=1 Tax=Adineta steineri TaxID=433720 RepID=A0A814MMH5_9BILA|nr:unnamed protein product [Adineta steineri]